MKRSIDTVVRPYIHTSVAILLILFIDSNNLLASLFLVKDKFEYVFKKKMKDTKLNKTYSETMAGNQNVNNLDV